MDILTLLNIWKMGNHHCSIFRHKDLFLWRIYKVNVLICTFTVVYFLLSEDDLEISEEIRSDESIADEDPKAQSQKKTHKIKIPKNIKMKNPMKHRKNPKPDAATPETVLGNFAQCVHVFVGLLSCCLHCYMFHLWNSKFVKLSLEFHLQIISTI